MGFSFCESTTFRETPFRKKRGEAMAFRERLREWRESVGLTQQAVADAVGSALNTYSRWERGETEPKVSDLDALAASGADVAWLVTGKSRTKDWDDPSPAPPPSQAEAQFDGEINRDVLFTVIGALEEWLAVNNKLMRADAKARWIATAYILCMRAKSRARNQGAELDDSREVLSPLLDLVE